MSFELRLIVVALSSFAAAGVAAVALVPLLQRRLQSDVARTRATSLFYLRLVPALAAASATLLSVTSYLLFEPRGNHETPGLVLIGLTVLSAGVLATSAVRALRQYRATARIRRVWLARARPIALPGMAIPSFSVASTFPIVAVMGLVRPKLIIAESVLDACTPDELGAVLAHEQGHLDRRDNLRRALMAITPDVLAWTPHAREVASDWHVATEQAADEHAARVGPEGRTLLAQALIRVARLAVALPRVDDLPTSALYRGENIEARVRGLLAPPKPIPPRPRFVVRLAVAATSTVIAGLALGAIQGLIEVAVNLLP
jgi:beta-lactamase regulating signal transducer with metallopeptidase domain